LAEKREMLYEGKAKKVFVTSEPELIWIEFKDDATAFDGVKKERIDEKGALNNSISTLLFEMLEREGVETQMVRKLSGTEMLAKKLEIIPVEVIVRNFATGSLSKRLGIEEGKELSPTVLEFCLKDDELHDPMLNRYHIFAMDFAAPEELVCLKDDELHDPMLNRYHIFAMDLAAPEELVEMEKQALRINGILVPYLLEKGITLVDFKLEFGRYRDRIILGDEITPDTCRFWNTGTMFTIFLRIS